MRVVVAGACGFAGSTIALRLQETIDGLDVVGIDNFIRPGSELNRRRLATAGIRVIHADVRVREDLDDLPRADWVLDASANPTSDPTGALAFNKAEVNRDGVIDLKDAKIVDYFAGASYRNLAHQSVAVVGADGDSPLYTQSATRLPINLVDVGASLGPEPRSGPVAGGSVERDAYRRDVDSVELEDVRAARERAHAGVAGRLGRVRRPVARRAHPPSTATRAVRIERSLAPRSAPPAAITACTYSQISGVIRSPGRTLGIPGG